MHMQRAASLQTSITFYTREQKPVPRSHTWRAQASASLRRRITSTFSSAADVIPRIFLVALGSPARPEMIKWDASNTRMQAICMHVCLYVCMHLYTYA